MNAPDEHWLLVKNLWLPIENALDSIGAAGEDTREKIDSLTGKLSPSLIKQLHYLRMERNSLIHNNKPLQDAGRWKVMAVTSHQAIQEASDTENSSTDIKNRGIKEKFLLNFYPIAGFAIWVIGSFALKELCNFLFTKVNQFSLAWWLIGTIWLLSWPGIIIGGLIAGVISLLIAALNYFISNPF